MDGIELFRKLGFGARFDLKRFHSDAQKLKIVKPSTDGAKHKSLDFFSETVPEKDVSASGNASGKRKAPPDKSIKKKKKKLEEESTDDPESDDNRHEDEIEHVEEEEEDYNEDESEDDDVEDEVTLLGSMKSSDQLLAREQRAKKKKKKKMTPEKQALLKQEEVNHLRRIHRLHVQGTDIPEPKTSFEALLQEGLQAQVLENLRSMGFTEPTPIQMQAIPLMMQRRELLACAPTGSGKTAAFVLPILQQLRAPMRRGFRALVLSPTRELAMQTYRVFCQLADGIGFRIHYIEKASTAAKKFGPKSSQRFDILVTTPNRLVYMLQQEPPVISLKNIEWLIVDESDKLFEEGKRGFRDQLATIYKACDGSQVRRAMFSATFAYDVEQWCKLNLDNVVQVYVGAKNSATDTVDQKLLFVGSEPGKLIEMRNIIQKGLTPPVLVFVQSKERAMDLFQELIYDGINVDIIHSDRTQLQRDNTVRSFRAGQVWVLICTELMGRGIDFKGVNLVINYDFPTSAISYIHRVGRTGRAGRRGQAITFFTEDDAFNLRSIANVMRTSGCEVPDYMLRIAAPRKDDRRRLAKSAPKRKGIRTLPRRDIPRSEKLRKKPTPENGETPGGGAGAPPGGGKRPATPNPKKTPSQQGKKGGNQQRKNGLGKKSWKQPNPKNIKKKKKKPKKKNAKQKP